MYDFDQKPVDSRTATKGWGALWTASAIGFGFAATYAGMSALKDYTPSILPWQADNIPTATLEKFATMGKEAAIGVIGSIATRINMPYPSSPLSWGNKGAIQVLGAAGAAAAHYGVCHLTGHVPSLEETAAVASAGAYATSFVAERIVAGIGKACCGFFAPKTPADQASVRSRLLPTGDGGTLPTVNRNPYGSRGPAS